MLVVDELLDELAGSSCSPSWILGPSKICVATREEYKTIFGTQNGMFELLVMPFRLTNAPTTF